MELYDWFMTPWEKLFFSKIRKEWVAHAKGDVLEIGVCTGVNFPYYQYSAITSFTATDIVCMDGMTAKAPAGFHFVQGCAEQLPFADNAFDSVVITLVLCSVAQPVQAVSEIKRVLKPGGKVIFVEHVLPPNKIGAWIFEKGNYLWSKVFMGCNINRSTEKLLKKQFTIEQAHTMGKGLLHYGVLINQE